MAVAVHDGGPGEDRVAEAPAAARPDAAQRAGGGAHRREAQVVAGLTRDPRDVAAAGLVDGDRVRARGADPGGGVVHAGRIGHPAEAAGEARQAQVHLHQRVRRDVPRRDAQRRGRLAAAGQGDGHRAGSRGEEDGATPAREALDDIGGPGHVLLLGGVIATS
jgi:hypothetical protein